MKLISINRDEPIIDSNNNPSLRLVEYIELNTNTVNQNSEDIETNTTAITDNANVIEVINQIKTKVVEIGDWNMDSANIKSVAHGLILEDIVGVSAIVRNDLNTEKWNIGTGSTSTDTHPNGFVGRINSSTVRLRKESGGKFDNTNYSSTSYNRGWVIITYINQ